MTYAYTHNAVRTDNNFNLFAMTYERHRNTEEDKRQPEIHLRSQATL